MKFKVVKKDNMDEQTRDEKEYLGSELFTILQQVKKDHDYEDDSFEEDEEAQPLN